jgi:hypothetical protein
MIIRLSNWAFIAAAAVIFGFMFVEIFYSHSRWVKGLATDALVPTLYTAGGLGVLRFLMPVRHR